MKGRDQLISELSALSTRLAYHPQIQPGDRDLLEETITYLSFLDPFVFKISEPDCPPFHNVHEVAPGVLAAEAYVPWIRPWIRKFKQLKRIYWRIRNGL